MKITCMDKQVKEILRSNFFVIPRFQRPYSWLKENVEDFWNDAIGESDDEHFIGSIVTYRATSEELGIVDGQQRLTTITLALCALRNSLAKVDLLSLANGVHSLVERQDLSDKARFVLRTESSYPYLQDHIQKFGDPELDIVEGNEEKLLKDAFELLSAKFESVIDAVQNDASLSFAKKRKQLEGKLLAIRDKLISVKLIAIELDDQNDAYFVFETLNKRWGQVFYYHIS